ncbi:MAG: hypothetical protein HKN41_09680 [Ilumatobacter sp.]|nr:hypothetical protein [Ilumatobacter sp.]
MDITDRARRLAERAARLPKRAGRKIKQITTDLPAPREAKERVTARLTSGRGADGDDGDANDSNPSSADERRDRRAPVSSPPHDPVQRAASIAADTRTRAGDALARARTVASRALVAEARLVDAHRQAASRVPPVRESIDGDDPAGEDEEHTRDGTAAGDRDDGGRGDGEPELAARTKDELYELAKEHDVEGRSSMNKDELVATLREHDVDA